MGRLRALTPRYPRPGWATARGGVRRVSSGDELYAERLLVRDDAFTDEFVGNCAYRAAFEDRSDE